MLDYYQAATDYMPSAEAIEKLKKYKSLSVKVMYVKGCMSCKKTMPVLKSVMQQLPEAKLEEVTLTRGKKDAAQLRKLGIKHLPALIISRNDMEKGKIEKPEWDNLEQKMLDICDVSQTLSMYKPSDWYELDGETVSELKECKNIKLQVFHADWCPDCTYTLPLLQKLLEQLPNIKAEEVIVDREKKDKNGLADSCNVKSIPTIIVYKNDIEKGRIVESPKETLEEDILGFYNEPMAYANYAPSEWYEADSAQLQFLNKEKGLKVTIFHADWCPDCTYTLPICKKLFAKLPNITIEDVVVDKQKKDAKGIAEKFHITNIPTLVVARENVEIGRIVESPSNTIEADIAEMLRVTPDAKAGKKKMK